MSFGYLNTWKNCAESRAGDYAWKHNLCENFLNLDDTSKYKIMKSILPIISLTLLIYSCQIKNKDSVIAVENGTDVKPLQDSVTVIEVKTKLIARQPNDTTDYLLGFWVGYFKKDEEYFNDKNLYVDEGYYWNRENKINISIDEISKGIIKGHSVVAGNVRPFNGSVKREGDSTFLFTVKEPGDDKYDGEFTFTISHGELAGKWTAYKKIEIRNRKYTLQKREYIYQPEIMLERAKEYVNWNEFLEKRERMEVDENEFEEWISREFASATNLIYKINASNKLLSKSEVENLKKGDLTIIRNTIYARHGYSFKNRPLRVFFDAQSWYIPVHSNIKSDFTEIEKQNIILLLRFEKNAAEYYDSFGRG